MHYFFFFKCTKLIYIKWSGFLLKYSNQGLMTQSLFKPILSFDPPILLNKIVFCPFG